MNALTDAVRSLRARAVTFELPDGSFVDIAPPNMAQVRACSRLDPKPGQSETAAQQIERNARQAEILLGVQHAGLLKELQPLQLAEVVGALCISATGLSPQDYVAFVRAQRKAGVVLTAHEVLERLEEISIDLSARLKKLPSEVDQMPTADAIALRQRLAELDKIQANLQATIAGTELRWPG